MREDYKYSGSEGEEEENAVAGEPSSIVHNAAAHQGGDTLRRNFQQIQECRFVPYVCHTCHIVKSQSPIKPLTGTINLHL